MKSWAVPKGPSLDPSVKRLAMEVEDHPIEYNTFEGTIPKGEYGGGTVMLWDRGTYSADAAASTDEEEDVIRDGYEARRSQDHVPRRANAGLVRARSHEIRARSVVSSKPQWLLIKHRDEFATEGDVVADNMTSVDTGRTMEEIAIRQESGLAQQREPQGKASWTSCRAKRRKRRDTKVAKLFDLEPMYASVGSRDPGRRLDVRAQVRRHSCPRLRHGRRREAHHAQRQGQGGAVPGNRRCAQEAGCPDEAVARARRRDRRAHRWRAGPVPGAAEPDAREGAARNRAVFFVDPGRTHSLRHSRRWRSRRPDQRALVRAPRPTRQAHRQASAQPSFA